MTENNVLPLPKEDPRTEYKKYCDLAAEYAPHGIVPTTFVVVARDMFGHGSSFIVNSDTLTPEQVIENLKWTLVAIEKRIEQFKETYGV
jgi:hypothetical protein